MKIQKYIGEVFSLIEQEKNENQKIRILKENKTPGMMEIFKFAYDPSYVSLVKNIPTYQVDDSPYGYSYSDLNKEYHRINYFYDYPNKNKIWNINPKQRNKILVNILERIHWSDAAILVSILTNKNIPNISLDLIKKAFPTFNISKETKEEITDE